MTGSWTALGSDREFGDGVLLIDGFWCDKDQSTSTKAEPDHTSLGTVVLIGAVLNLRTSTLQRFRGGLVFKAHRLLHQSTLGSKMLKKKKSIGVRPQVSRRCSAR